ncbi:unnamed protein product [Arctogadus glacialis]
MLNMGAVLLLLIGVADGVETFCDATQPHITTQCSGSLGGTPSHGTNEMRQTLELCLPSLTSPLWLRLP